MRLDFIDAIIIGGEKRIPFCPEFWSRAIVEQYKSSLLFNKILDIAELRKSCGAEPGTFTVKVNKPGRHV